MSNEKPWYPHVNTKDGVRSVYWGKAGWLFIVATLVMMGSSGLLAYRVDANEEDNKKTEKNMKIMDRNLHKVDEQVRQNAQAAGLANKQLRKLLELEGVTERIEPPEIEDSKLEELE